jgi:ABC-type multidrug transport system, ATPase component
VKILMTVIRASRCEGTLLGHTIGHKPTLSRVGYLPEHHKFPGYLRGREVLDFFGALSGVPRKTRRLRTAELLESVGMAEWAGKRVGGYSKGMRQRLGIAQALMNDPELVLLDEPTDGVDPSGRRDIRDIIRRLRGEGRAVLVNSHLLSELEVLADRVSILVQGLVRQQGTLDELTADQRRYVVEIAASDPEAQAAFSRVLAALPPDDAAGAAVDGRSLTLATTEAAAVQPVIDRLRAAGHTITAVRAVRPSLEDLFMQAVIDPATGEELLPGAEGAGKRGRKARRKGDRP